MKIQIDVSDDLDKKIEMYQAYKRLEKKTDAVVQMLEAFAFEVKVKE